MNKSLTFIACFSIIVGVIAGIFLWYVPAWLFNTLLLVTGIAVALLILAGVATVWNWAGRLNLIYPDDNGNYPIKMIWRLVYGRGGVGIEIIPMNLNLTGSNSYREWATWQVTNNNRASQPKELMDNVEAQPKLMLVSGPGQSLLIEAMAQEL